MDCVLSVKPSVVFTRGTLETASETAPEVDEFHATEPFGLYCAVTLYVPAWRDDDVREAVELDVSAVRLFCPRVTGVAVDEPSGVNCATNWTRPVGAVPSFAVTVAPSVTGLPAVTDDAETVAEVVVDAVTTLDVADAPPAAPKRTTRPATTAAVRMSARPPRAAPRDVAAKDTRTSYLILGMGAESGKTPGRGSYRNHPWACQRNVIETLSFWSALPAVVGR
jgi:hypothetical protein